MFCRTQHRAHSPLHTDWRRVAARPRRWAATRRRVAGSGRGSRLRRHATMGDRRGGGGRRVAIVEVAVAEEEEEVVDSSSVAVVETCNYNCVIIIVVVVIDPRCRCHCETFHP